LFIAACSTEGLSCPCNLFAGAEEGGDAEEEETAEEEEAAFDEDMLPASTLFYGVRGASCRGPGRYGCT